VTYYNTNNESGATLVTSQGNARSQEQVLRQHFITNPSAKMTAEDCERLLPGCPLTSVRRALTNLTKDGTVYKTPEMRIGKYGKQIHVYAVPEPGMNDDPDQLNLF